MIDKKTIKKYVVNQSFFSFIAKSITRKKPRIFVYHRFCSKKQNFDHRVSEISFEAQIVEMKKYGTLMSFSSCLEYFNANGRWPERAVVITVDDGYRDFYTYAYPILKRHKTPATLFVTTDFVDQKIWLWPDKLDFALRNTSLEKFDVTLQHGDIKTFDLENGRNLFAVWKFLSDYCIASPDKERQRVIDAVISALRVHVPEKPTDEYSAVNWGEVKEMAENGIEIGSHTISHPILSKIDPDQLVKEVCLSKNVLETQLDTQIKSFCYTNSHPGDINGKVVSEVKAAGYLGSPFWRDYSTFDPYLMPRIGLSNDMREFAVKLAGIEYLGQQLRLMVGGKGK